MLSKLPDKQFRRLTRVKLSTFTRMVKALTAEEQAKKPTHPLRSASYDTTVPAGVPPKRPLLRS
jgi:hypothetical protein